MTRCYGKNSQVGKVMCPPRVEALKLTKVQERLFCKGEFLSKDPKQECECYKYLRKEYSSQRALQAQRSWGWIIHHNMLRNSRKTVVVRVELAQGRKLRNQLH